MNGILHSSELRARTRFQKFCQRFVPIIRNYDHGAHHHCGRYVRLSFAKATTVHNFHLRHGLFRKNTFNPTRSLSSLSRLLHVTSSSFIFHDPARNVVLVIYIAWKKTLQRLCLFIKNFKTRFSVTLLYIEKSKYNLSSLLSLPLKYRSVILSLLFIHYTTFYNCISDYIYYVFLCFHIVYNYIIHNITLYMINYIYSLLFT